MSGQPERRDAAVPDEPIAIVCGGGSLPLAVADAASRRGRRAVMLAVRGFADPQVERYRCHWIALGQLGRVFGLLRAEGCRDVVFIGGMLRPALARIRLDWTTIRAVPRILRAFRGGDDHLLASIARLFEDAGFRLVGAHEVAPELLLPEGALGTRGPSERDRADIEHGLALLSALGPFDVGQAAVVAGRHVIAVEAAEGTDRMLERVAALRRDGRIRSELGRGVLVKTPKPTQDRRFDLPSIGPPTIAGLAKAGLAGLAATAGETFVAEPGELLRAAEAAGVFVIGMPSHGAGA
ncbi:MAG TPA: UDP-2,3-diacylglucosamine diphosphatase LpxI [Xanthobacteraceae bacterium]|nr:UDP-2,3-diacylglucosamine diphosphatase LpxI [Xanthobacteraceae bacterium]